MHPVPALSAKILHLEIVVQLIQLRGVDAGPKAAGPRSNNKTLLISGRRFAKAEALPDGVVHYLLEIPVRAPSKLFELQCQIILES